MELNNNFPFNILRNNNNLMNKKPKIYIENIKRKKAIEKLHKLKKSFYFSEKIFHLSILLMDKIYEEFPSTDINKIDKILFGTFIITLKYFSIQTEIPNLINLKNIWNNVYYSPNKDNEIINLEFFILKHINYKLNYITCIDILDLFFNQKTISNNLQKIYNNLYKSILYIPYYTSNINLLNYTCAIIYISISNENLIKNLFNKFCIKYENYEYLINFIKNSIFNNNNIRLRNKMNISNLFYTNRDCSGNVRRNSNNNNINITQNKTLINFENKNLKRKLSFKIFNKENFELNKYYKTKLNEFNQKKINNNKTNKIRYRNKNNFSLDSKSKKETAMNSVSTPDNNKIYKFTSLNKLIYVKHNNSLNRLNQNKKKELFLSYNSEKNFFPPKNTNLPTKLNENDIKNN